MTYPPPPCAPFCTYANDHLGDSCWGEMDVTALSLEDGDGEPGTFRVALVRTNPGGVGVVRVGLLADGGAVDIDVDLTRDEAADFALAILSRLRQVPAD